MSTIASVVLGLHIVAGYIALVVAPGAMLTAKGGWWHRRCGKIYVWAMAIVAITAVVLSLYRPNLFLLLLAVFSFYQAFSGYRVLARKLPHQGQRVMPLDWAAAALTFMGSAALVVYGLARWNAGSTFFIVPIIFGVLGTVLAGRDVHSFLRPPMTKNAWWFTHMGHMLGAYIATVSAFSVVNFSFLPPLLRWLWPTAIGVPGIFIWISYYRRKFSRTGRLSGAQAAVHGRVNPVQG
jgi:uncharacterized membrane protein